MNSNDAEASYAIHGLAMGTLLPLAIGLSLLVRFWSSLAPTEPGTANCGMGALPGILIAILGSPVGAILGGFVGSLIKRQRWTASE